LSKKTVNEHPEHSQSGQRSSKHQIKQLIYARFIIGALVVLMCLSWGNWSRFCITRKKYCS